jgi:hypothetical protein
MSIGSGIALIVIGAILTFAITIEISWIDLDIVGSILMGAGLVIFILGIVGMTRKRQVVETVRVAADPATGQQVTERKTSAPR